MGSFKVRLAAYFALVALLPFAAAFQGFRSLSGKSETRKVDAVLQSGLRAAIVAYEDDLGSTQRAATTFANRRDLQRALLTQDRKALARIVGAVPNVRVDAGRLSVGHTPTGAATRTRLRARSRRPSRHRHRGAADRREARPQLRAARRARARPANCLRRARACRRRRRSRWRRGRSCRPATANRSTSAIPDIARSSPSRCARRRERGF